MKFFKYYLVDNGVGVPYEIYRGNASYEFFFNSDLERAKKDGSWSTDDSDINPLLDLWHKGNFIPSDDEITEAEAMEYLESWRLPGCWPSRP